MRKMRRDRMRVKLAEIKEEMRRRRHQPISKQGEWLAQVVTGFFNYHAVPTNYRSLRAFRVMTGLVPVIYVVELSPDSNKGQRRRR